MKIDRLVLGEFETNCYILRSDEPRCIGECLIIDTGLDVRELLTFLERNKLTPKALVITHGHIDHIAGVEKLRAVYSDIAVYIHKLDAETLTDSMSNLSFMLDSADSQADRSFSTEKADYLVDEPDVIEAAGIKLKVIHTPGHTPGGMCLYCEKENAIFVGDTLFADSVGRTDFPGGNMRQLIEGIKNKLLTLPDDTVVYPGHGNRTTIGREKTHNPFLY
jgi:glyoxylase-like metal-dependent hydrolase (beta-lactamase superfamily II)